MTLTNSFDAMQLINMLNYNSMLYEIYAMCQVRFVMTYRDIYVMMCGYSFKI
jgi:hypothetical protein